MAKKAALPQCMGIPVRYDAGLAMLSDSRGLGPWKKIVVGPTFQLLNDRQKGAVLLHEVGHCKLCHTEKILAHLLARPRLMVALIMASLNAARRFKKHSPQALAFFQQEIERLAPGTAAFRQRLEHEADSYAAGCGYGAELAQVLQGAGDAGGGFHPDVESRVRHVLGESHG